MTRTPFVGGNWKCNGTRESVKALVETLNGAADGLPENLDVVVSPAALHIDSVNSTINKKYKVAAQNCWKTKSGAYTGELSADMIVDFGLSWVVVGHSERRTLIKESDELLAEKTAYALEKGLSVIFCIGETLEQREAGKTMEVVSTQMAALLQKVTDFTKVVVAYEPVWAIGTGKVATPEEVQNVHSELRKWFASNAAAYAAGIRLIYGGSVNAGNCKTLASLEDVDGFLVGGASLKPEFADICKAMAS